ncbi:hypothetical protein STEG23_033084 [Scotinomys teguina]
MVTTGPGPVNTHTRKTAQGGRNFGCELTRKVENHKCHYQGSLSTGVIGHDPHLKTKIQGQISPFTIGGVEKRTKDDQAGLELTETSLCLDLPLLPEC